jgi:hypothetical protein
MCCWALRDGKTINNLAGLKGNKYLGERIVDPQRLNLFCDENPQSVVRTHRGTADMVQMHPNYGNTDGPTTLSGTGKRYAVPGWTDEQTQYWIDQAKGPKD